MIKMFHLKLVVLTFLIATAFCGDDEGGEKGKDKCDKGKGKHHGGWHKHHEKIKQCAQETNDLEQCCPQPSADDLLADENCSTHLAGVEQKDEKEQGKAYKCFTECIFKDRNMFVDGELVESEVKKFVEDRAGENLSEITKSSADYCFEEFKKKKEEWGKWKTFGEQITNATKGIEININNQTIGIGHLLKGFGMKLGGGDKEKDKKKEEECNFMPIAVSMCILGRVVRNCPETVWLNTDSCNELKSNVTTIEECMKH